MKSCILLCLLSTTVLAESRTVTLWYNGDPKNGPLKAEDVYDLPAHYSATLLTPGGGNSLKVEKDGVTFDQGFPAPFTVTGPCRLRWSTTGSPLPYKPSLATFRIDPETFDASKALVLGPTTNTVVVSFQSSSNLVDWATVTNQVFEGIPAAQFFRVTVAPPSTP